MSQIKAFFFDQDGVIVDTERDGHRVAFNRTFAEFGFDVQWGVEEYHGLLQVGGGKERMMHYLQTQGFGVEVKPEDAPDLIQRLHLRKTDLFIELIESGTLPLRPGVRRIMEEAELGNDARHLHDLERTGGPGDCPRPAGGYPVAFVLAGDVVPAKKPDPAIYRLALERADCGPTSAWCSKTRTSAPSPPKPPGCTWWRRRICYTENED
jgi:beta-phosphoglucomutase-like phosphatase (HAD superfamily)